MKKPLLVFISLQFYLYPAFLIFCSCKSPLSEGPQAQLITSIQVPEVSGIEASYSNSGVLWMHNDSGDRNRIFAFSEGGRLLAEYVLAGAAAVDYEDITLGPGPESGKSYLYVADVGDNFESRDFYTIYRLQEPVVTIQQQGGADTLENVDAIHFVYPDGSKNCETVMIEPQTGDIFLLTKSRNSDQRLYRLPFPQTTTGMDTLLFETTVAAPDWVQDQQFTAGDISDSGLKITVKTYNEVLYWTRLSTTPLAEVLNQRAARLEYVIESQGEAICFSPGEDGYYTISEKNDLPLYLYFYEL